MKSLFTRLNGINENLIENRPTLKSISYRKPLTNLPIQLPSSSSSSSQSNFHSPVISFSSSSTPSTSFQSPIELTHLTKTVSDMAKYEETKPLSLFIEVDYLGYLDIESKYMQNAVLQWLIAQVKLVELNKRIDGAFMEINVKTNTIHVYKNDETNRTTKSNMSDLPSSMRIDREQALDKQMQSNKIVLFTHSLSNIFKLFGMDNDSNCFAYFYRKPDSFAYTLHVFHSSRSNMLQVMQDFQKQASRLHDNLHFQRVFDFKLISRIKTTADELKASNFIENLIDKATSNMKLKRNSSQPTSLKSLEQTNKQQALQFNDRDHIYLKFDSSKIYFRELDGEWTGHDFKHVLCLNNSIIYENFFCIAYEVALTSGNSTRQLVNEIHALILYSESSELIDNVIREYALSISSKVTPSSIHSSPASVHFQTQSNQAGLVFGSKVEQHTCSQCPMQQFVELCEHLNTLSNDMEHISYLLFEKLNYNLSDLDQKFILDSLSEQKLTFDSYDSSLERNQLLVGLIHKLCNRKQTKHLLFIFDRKEAMNHYLVSNEADDEFSLSANNRTQLMSTMTSKPFSKQSTSFYANLSGGYLDNILKDEFKKHRLLKRRRSNTLDSSEMTSIKKILDYSLQVQKQTLISKDFGKLLIKTLLQGSEIKTPSIVLCPAVKMRSKDSMRRSIFNRIVGSSVLLDDLNASCDHLNCISPAESNKNLHKNLFEDENDNFDIVGSDKENDDQDTRLDANMTKKHHGTNSVNEKGRLSAIFKRFKSRNDVVQFWKKVISEQILLNKMEKENTKLKTRISAQSLEERKRLEKITFGYPEITPCLKGVSQKWQAWLDRTGIGTRDDDTIPYSSTQSSISLIDYDEIRQTVLKGVPQSNRGQIWLWLKDQYRLRQKNKKLNGLAASISDGSVKLASLSNQSKINKLDESISYKDLLKQTTIHQHSILLDLDRTFPTHPNFEKKFGAGQLALFNVLKAYSILDNEVGYCQGLSFIVGILLIHVKNNEEMAFDLLKFLLIDLNLREQYRPDMLAFQKHMYQFTRLLHDLSFEIYNHLEEHDVSTSLYAAPWFLTMYSSQFHLGFISRVFDFLFTEGPNVLFKVSLSILNIHRPILLTCDTFESIVDHIKMAIPEMSLIECELIINKSFNVDLSTILNVYEIEFNVLNEDFQASTTSLLSNSVTNNLIRNLNDDKSFRDKKQKNKSYSAKQTSIMQSNQQIARVNEQLELENLKLKNQVNELLSRLSLIEIKRQNQDDAFYKLYHENKQLKCKIQTLELERSSLVAKLNRK